MIRNQASGISGQTRLVGIIGWPVGHSLSPRMHNAAFAALGLDWAYVPLPVPPERVGDAVRGLAALGFAGANVTVPHKQAVIPFLDDLTPVARAIGAVNTIVVRPDGLLLGDSTDGAGFMADLQAHGVRVGQGHRMKTDEGMVSGHTRIAVSPCHRVLVLGGGGAARAVVYALAESGAAVTVANRTPEKADRLCQDMAAALPAVAGRLRACRWPDDLAAQAAEADLIVNTTSLGLHEEDPMPWDAAVAFRPGQVVYDLIYNRPTELLAAARSQGATACNGSGMLVCQGALAFELWTGRAAPVEVMMRTMCEA